MIKIKITTQHKSRATCPNSEFVFPFNILTFTTQSYPKLQMATYWIGFSLHDNKVFSNTYHHDTLEFLIK